MGRQCAIIPKVLNKKGDKVDSRLFKDLLSYIPNNRAQVVKIYQITKNPEFIKRWHPKLKLDDNSEPTLGSLLSEMDLSDFIGKETILKTLNKNIGHYVRGTDKPVKVSDTPEYYEKLTAKVRDFNKNSEFRKGYVARLTKSYDEETSNVVLGIEVEHRNKDNSTEAEQLEYNAALNERLRSILNALGVKTGTLTELERRMGINGVTDFSLARNAAEGILELIRLAEGVKGEKALPEEFAHFALEALGEDNALSSRLISLIASEGLAGEILGDEYATYDTLYDHNRIRLAKEAAGKLLAKHLLNNEEIPAKPYKSLLQRLISSIKNFFRRISGSTIQDAMNQANRAAGLLASDILSGNASGQMRLSNITETELFYNTSERVTRDKKLLQGIIETELKRLTVYEKRNPDGTFSTNQRLFIDKLEESLADNNEIEGIYTFIEKALATMASLDTRLTEVVNDSTSSINDKAKVLRDIRNYRYSYQHMVDDIRDVLLDEEKFTDNRYGDRVKEALGNLTNLLANLEAKYAKVSKPLFTDFIRKYVGEGLTTPFGSHKGDIITPEDIVKKAERDITIFDRWLDSMADSSNYVLNIFDHVVKMSKEQARLDTIDIKKELEAAAMKLEQSGIKGTDWMFERDADGNLTGDYIQDIDWALFKSTRKKFFEELKSKYGKNPVGEDAEKYREEVRKWYKENTDTINGKSIPKLSIYESKIFSGLSAAQREYYNTIMGIKAKLDSYLPDKYTRLTSAVKIRKDLIERVKSSDNPSDGIRQLWENIKDQFIRRSDDTEFGDRAAFEDFEGNEVQLLPIYYTRLRKGESPNDMSTDVTSTLTAYAAMANDYHEMNKVIDILELGRDYLRDKYKVEKTNGDKGVSEKFTIMGRKIENKLFKPKHSTRVLERLDDFFDMIVYGRYKEDEGTIGKTNIDKAKAMDAIRSLTSVNSLALNVLAGISNVATGEVMMRIESFSGEFFGKRDTLRADWNYSKAMPEFMAEIGKKVKTSKLALWSEMFDVMQEYDGDIRNTNFERKSWFSRMFTTSSLFLMNNIGEHWMQHRTSLALAEAYKMKDKDGNIVSLWDAMEVVYIDPSNHALGAKLQVKKGYTKEDGTAFTEEDIKKFSRKSAAINQKMHGIYNNLDKNAIQKMALGRMAMQFRKWMRPSFRRRFRQLHYNFDTETWEEGYYTTALRFLGQIAKELKEGQFALIANFDKLTLKEKANIRRAITEVVSFLAVVAALALIDWPDDKDRPWAVKMIEYQLRRLKTELGVLVPGPQMANEGLKILKSPAAGVNTIEDILNLTGLFNPYNYEEVLGGEEAVLKSGRFKGHNKATKLFFESPIIPANKTIWRAIHPEEGIPFYKQ